MSNFQDSRLFDLVHPGTHNSGTYTTKNSLSVIKKFVVCQELTIYQQLECGVRVFDLRIAGYLPNPEISKEINFWVAHTFLCVPLSEVLSDIAKFINEHPTEVIVVKVLADIHPANADNIFRVKKPSSKLMKLRGPKDDLVKYMLQEIGEE